MNGVGGERERVMLPLLALSHRTTPVHVIGSYVVTVEGTKIDNPEEETTASFFRFHFDLIHDSDPRARIVLVDQIAALQAKLRIGFGTPTTTPWYRNQRHPLDFMYQSLKGQINHDPSGGLTPPQRASLKVAFPGGWTELPPGEVKGPDGFTALFTADITFRLV
jgi:hypothetical protein